MFSSFSLCFLYTGQTVSQYADKTLDRQHTIINP
jgi:hypothetical protein